MKIFALVLVIALVGAGVWALRSGKLTLPKQPAVLGQSGEEVTQEDGGGGTGEFTSSIQAGIQNISEKISGVVNSVSSTAVQVGSVLGVKEITEGSTPKAEELIDVNKMITQTQSQIYSIPGTLAKNAQIEYCLRVLKEATASGQSQ